MDELKVAQAAILADQKRRTEAAKVAVEAALAEHRCQIIAVPQIVDGRIVAQVQIVPVQEQG